MDDPKHRATVPFDEIEPGDPVGTLVYTLTPELADRHLRATGQAPYDDADVAPISILSQEGVNLADRHWNISESVHAGQRTEVLALPRNLGPLTLPETEEGAGETHDVLAYNGRFGPYLKCGKATRSIPAEDHLLTIDLARAVELIDAKHAAGPKKKKRATKKKAAKKKTTKKKATKKKAAKKKASKKASSKKD